MENRNMLLALVLSVLVLFGWSVLFPQPEQPAPVQSESTKAKKSEEVVTAEEEPSSPATLETAATTSSIAPGATSAIEGEKVSIGNGLLSLDIDDKGRIVSATLSQYMDSKETDAKPVAILGEDEPHAMYVSASIKGMKRATPFGITSNEKAADGSTRLVLRATLENGQIWERTFILKSDAYLLSIEDRVSNGTGVELFQQVVERYPDREGSNLYQHTGPIGLSLSTDGNKELHEVSFDDLDESESNKVQYASPGGWIGNMSQYFLTAIYGDQEKDYRYYFNTDGRSYQSIILQDATMEGGTALFKSNVFIGPKNIELLKAQGVGLERSVDYGWFAFISKPLHDGLNWLYNNVVANYGWCIILLVIGLKILFIYPTHKSYQSMAAMRRIQPEQKRLQELYGDDRQRMGQEMMALYKKHKVNPLGGCLPILIQIPVFFALYKVLLMSIEMRHAPFIGWINDLSAMDPYYVLPLLMGASMYIQQKLNPQPPDPMQAKIFQFMPVVFTVMFAFFPAGLVLYWVVNNVLSIIQQRFVMHKMGVQ